jgi:hypothetical protein
MSGLKEKSAESAQSAVDNTNSNVIFSSNNLAYTVKPIRKDHL